MNCTKESLQLYLVTDRHWLHGRRLVDDVRAALDGGVTFVQIREKNDMAMGHDEFKQEVLEIQALCREYGVPLVIDDDVELAVECGCDGVHVGQSDMEAGTVRERLGKDKILGVTAHSVEEAMLAQERGADYLGVGAMFHTGSKADANELSHDVVREICDAVSIPVIGIGGITRDNVVELEGTGICGIAVISAILASDNVREAAADLKAQTSKALGL